MPESSGRPYTGAEDFMDLFKADAAWDAAASHVGVFKLYGEWVAYHATAEELRTAVQGIAQRGMALAVEMGPLDPPPTCGEGVESFAGIDEGQLISRRIRQAGGALQVIALDEPYFFSHVYDGPNACHLSVGKAARGVARFTRAMRDEWPGVVVGDTEPMPVPVGAGNLASWLDAYRAAAGEPFAFLHLDMDWSRPNWPALGVAVEAAGRARDVPVGIIYQGGYATSDEQWLAVTGQRVVAYETDAGARPDHVLFQSWTDKPDRSLPESDAATFTSFIDRYVDDPDSLGSLPGGVDNLALGRPAVASSSLRGAKPGKAVDGDADTIWSAGVGPPAWIRIDLGAPQPVGQIRLQVSQFPAGKTHHTVSCSVSPDGPERILADLFGRTQDLDVLTITLDQPVTCRLLLIETLASPSWVAWREIEVLAPGG
jgi:hypothetical protein